MCAEGGANLPIAHALCLPEPTKKTNLRVVSLRFAPVLWPPSYLEVRGRKERKKEEGKKEEGKKEEGRIMPSLVATTSALTRTTFAPILLK